MADALLEWRKATLLREKQEATLYLSFKMREIKKTVGEVEAMVKLDDSRFSARLNEAVKESDYQRLYERLMAAKKMADLRSAF